MVVEEVPNRPSFYKPIYRVTFAPHDMVGNGPPSLEDKLAGKWVSEIYLAPNMPIDVFKQMYLYTDRLAPYLESHCKIHHLYDD